MPIPQDYKELIGLLLQQTRQNGIDWEPTDVGSFFVAFNDRSLTISVGGGDYPEDSWVGFGLLDQNGKSIDWFTVNEGEAEYTVLKELHDLARRKAHNVKATLESLTQLLKKKK